MNEQNSVGMNVSRAPTLEEDRERWVEPIKEFRKEIDALIQKVPQFMSPQVEGGIYPNALITREARDQVRLNLIGAKMWAGKMLEGLGNPFPAELADKAN